LISKSDLLKKIDTLVLLADKTRESLINFVHSQEEGDNLETISKLLDKEPVIIHELVDRLIEDEVAAGDPSIFQILDESLRETKNVQRESSHLIETNEREEEGKKAEDILNQME
jgi:hypothetical protein